MRKLIHGIHRFQTKYWSADKELYRRLAEEGQFPDALFITCSDSRIAPLRITQSQPGDLFILRNIGNFVPPYSEERPDTSGVGAAVEFAVEHLQVRDIIVCGHSGCGALEALRSDPSRFSGMPHLAKWLEHGERTLEVLAANYPAVSREDWSEIASQENVLVQMENLRSYPSVRKAAREGLLHVHAWYYEIGTGKIYRYAPEKEEYEPIQKED